MTLFTSGYEGETINFFLHKLLTRQIKTVIDIRQNPFSRKEGFSKQSLSKYLTYSGIKYYHFRELGTPEPLRNYLAEKGDYEKFFELYKSFLPEFRDSLDDLVDMGTKEEICILCFEKDPHFCHRTVVAELLKEYSGKKIQIVHL